MLFEGAIRFLETAERGFELEDPAESNQTIHNNIQKTQDILHELNMALDIQNGGELAQTLRNLYEYIDRRLVESDLRKNSEGLIEARRHLGILRDAWAQMLRGEQTPEPMRNLMVAA
jgi:flagellar secretion chaperone FliS